MNIQRFLHKYRHFILGIVLILVGLFVWTVSGSLVDFGNSIASGVEENNNKVQEKVTPVEQKIDTAELDNREYIDTPEGKKYLVEGSDTDKAFQCVYDYFGKHLPEITVKSTNYRVYEDGNNNYVVTWGDWVVFVQKSNASGGFFLVQLNKSVEFTTREKTILMELAPGTFIQEGDLYEYKFD